MVAKLINVRESKVPYKFLCRFCDECAPRNTIIDEILLLIIIISILLNNIVILRYLWTKLYRHPSEIAAVDFNLEVPQVYATEIKVQCGGNY